MVAPHSFVYFSLKQPLSMSRLRFLPLCLSLNGLLLLCGHLTQARCHRCSQCSAQVLLPGGAPSPSCCARWLLTAHSGPSSWISLIQNAWEMTPSPGGSPRSITDGCGGMQAGSMLSDGVTAGLYALQIPQWDQPETKLAPLSLAPSCFPHCLSDFSWERPLNKSLASAPLCF